MRWEGVSGASRSIEVTHERGRELITPSTTHTLPSHCRTRLLTLPDNMDCHYDPNDEDFEVTGSQLTRRMKHLTNVLNHFWKRWRTEYLHELRESHRYAMKKTSQSSKVKTGDVVIVHDDTLPQGFWKLGRIQEVFEGRDGLPRSALVRVAAKQQQHTLLKRPLQRLYPLEIEDPETVSNPKTSNSSPEVISVDQEEPVIERARLRPLCAAAKEGNERRRVWVQELENTD